MGVSSLHESSSIKLEQHLFLVGALFYPLWSLFLAIAVPTAYDIASGRIAVGVFGLCLLLLTYRFEWAHQRTALLKYLYVYVGTAQFASLIYLSNGSTIYAIGNIIFSAAVSMLFTKPRPYAIFTTYWILLNILAISHTPMSPDHVAMVFGGILTTHFVIGYLLYSRTKALMQVVEQQTRADALQRQILTQELEKAKESAEMLRKRAYYDFLTGLANRAMFRDTLNRQFAAARRTGSTLGILFIDLDGFKAINDSRGHDVGDSLLKEFAVRLDRSLRQEDLAARIGGDEFAAILSEISDPQDPEVICNRILEEVSTPIKVGVYECKIGASIGLAITPRAGQDPTEQIHDPVDLIKQADIAMYVAKESGKNGWVSYSEELAYLNAKSFRKTI